MDKDAFIALLLPPLAAVFGIINSVRLRKLRSQTSNWKQTRGRVLESKIIGGGKASGAFVLYEFTVNTKFVSSRLCAPGCEDGDPKVVVQWYHVNREIAVYYNPSDPQHCLLELPSPRAIKGWTALAIIGLTFPFIYLVWLEYLKSWLVD